MMKAAAILVILVDVIVSGSYRDKRILLHSDLDIAQGIQDLRTEVSQLKTENSQFKTDIGQLRTENGQLKTDIRQLKTENTRPQHSVTGSGTTYVRWGRTTCDANGTTLAYAGYMGGGHHGNADSSSVVNYLCLTADPLWDHYDAIQSLGIVYGVEYEVWHHRTDGAAGFFGKNVYNQDAPCAVCHSPRSAAMMIPGRNQCYPGWTKEYSGYLMSGDHASHTSSQYVCMDRRPEFVAGGAADDEDTKLYLVEGACGGSLKCPPYVQGRELACVVCTK